MNKLSERLRRYVSVSNGKALVPVLPRDLREAADALDMLEEALERIVTLIDEQGCNAVEVQCAEIARAALAYIRKGQDHG